MKEKIVRLIKNSWMFLKNNMFIAIAIVFVFGLTTAASVVAAKRPRYSISSLSDLKDVENNLSARYMFSMSNLVISDDWEPIGSVEKPFTGTIDGNGVTISFRNLDKSFNFVEQAEEYVFGLFGCNKGTIKNINFYFENFSVVGEPNDNIKRSVYGSVAAYNYGKIENCSFIRASGGPSITASNELVCGSVFGIGGGTIKNVYSTTAFKITCDSLIYGGCCGIANTDCEIDKFFSSNVLEGIIKNTSLTSGVTAIQTGTSTLKISNTLNQSNFNKVASKNPSLAAGFLCDSRDDCFTSIKNSLNRSFFDNEKQTCSGFVYFTNKVLLENLLSTTSFSTVFAKRYNFLFNSNEIVTNNLFYRAKFDDDYGSQKDNVSIAELNWDESIWEYNNGEYILRWKK